MKKIEEIIRTYKTLEFYKDKGHQIFTSINSIDGIENKNKITFETQFDRKGSFDFKYVKFNEQNKIELNGRIAKENNGAETKSIIEFAGGKTSKQELPLNIAIASHTGISEGVAYIIPSLLYGNQLGGYLFYEDTNKEAFECEILEEQCIGIKTIRIKETKVPDKAELMKVRDQFKNDPSMKEAMEQLEEQLDLIKNQKMKITNTSIYYFRVSDNLLIRVDKYSKSDNHNFKSVTNYEPEISK